MRKLNKPKAYKHLTDKIRIEKHTVEYDQFDLHKFRDLLEDNNALADQHKQALSFYPQYNELHQDLFDILYKYEPRKIAENKIDHTYFLNSLVINEILENSQYKELRAITKLDELSSSIGLESINDDVIKLIKKLKDEYEETLQKMEKAAAGGKPSDKEGDQEGEGQQALTLEQAQEVLEKYKQEFKEDFKKQQKNEISKILEQAVDKAIETNDFISEWGLQQDPNFVRGDYQSKMKILDKLRNSKKLHEIAKLLGKYRQLAISSQKEKIKHGMEEFTDVVLGNDLSRLLTTELVKIKHPILKKDFYKKFSEKELLQYEYISKKKKNKGPIVACLDSSGSMSGQAEAWSKAVALGILEIAKIQKRPMYVIHFDCSSKKNLHTNTFANMKEIDVNEIVDMCEYFSGGGTNFEPPLELAKDKIDLDKNFTKADVIFITDGEAAVTNNFAKKYQNWKKEKNIKVFSVLIDVTSNTDVAVKLFSDRVEFLKSLRSECAEELACDIFSFL